MMAFLRTVVSSIVLVGLGAAWLQAQSARGRVILAPQGRPRVAYVAPPPPPPRVVSYGPTVFANYATIILPDGRVVVDLGNGYQEVAEPCAYAYGYGCVSYGYPVVSYPAVYYAPPVYVAPVYPTIVYPAPVYPAPGPRGCYSCIEPSRTSGRSRTVPATAGARAAPPRSTPGRVLTPVRGGRP